ncbi:MAG: SRPBCC family protein [Gemmatimonadota bacterium]|nr:SRPBCC family protein [Gemmatimonadota bacterium]
MSAPDFSATIEPKWRSAPGGIHVLRARQRIEAPRTEVFPFFASAENLGRITPPELHFEIVTPPPIVMRARTLIDYRLRLFGIGFGWRTEIIAWDPPGSFVDEQVGGPYHTWIHRHDFEEDGGATLMTDVVRYRLPVWPLGEVALPVVWRQLHRIFRYRARVIAEIFA